MWIMRKRSNPKQCFSCDYFVLSRKVYTFAPMNVKSVTYSMQTLQRNSKFFASFYAIYLVNPNNCVTHTHTHTHILTSAPTRA